MNFGHNNCFFLKANKGYAKTMKNIYRDHFPKRKEENRINSISGLLIFIYSDNEFCIDLESLSEIRNVNEIEININSKKEAIILLDNNEYKLIQMHKLLGFPEVIKSENNRVIFVDIYNKKIAFITEKINEILTTEYFFVGTSLAMEIIPVKKYIKSLIKFQGRDIYLPDFKKITKELNQLAIMSGLANKSKRHPGNYNYSK